MLKWITYQKTVTKVNMQATAGWQKNFAIHVYSTKDTNSYKSIRKPSRKTGKRFERISSQKIFKWPLIICSYSLIISEIKLKSHWGTTTYQQWLTNLTYRQIIPNFELLTVLELWDLYSWQYLSHYFHILINSVSWRLRAQL